SATDIENTVEALTDRLETDNAKTEIAIGLASKAAGTAAINSTADSLTKTAILWTHTPTPDIRGTANSRITATRIAALQAATTNAQATIIQESRNKTATAMIWTATASATSTPSFTYTPIPPTLTPTATRTNTPAPMSEIAFASNRNGKFQIYILD